MYREKVAFYNHFPQTWVKNMDHARKSIQLHEFYTYE